MEANESNAPLVLVVDDEEVIRWSIEQTLRSEGYRVVSAGSGSEGLLLLRQLSPQVVLLDVRLADVSGLALLREMRSEQPRGALIVMTAFEEDCTAATAQGLGADGYLCKPFDFDSLAALVREAAARAAG